MANMNITSPTAAKIFASWLKQGQSERPRTYLGASIVGHECEMYLWLQFRGAVNVTFDGRMYRLFDRGKREEAVFCDDLRRIGCEVREFDENGNQWAVSDLGGHFGGHLDGLVKGLSEAPNKWHVVEFKTHSDASFKKLCKEGVKKAKPMHYAQMTVYMGKVNLDSALYMAVNKDNDDLWCERISFSKSDYEAIMERAKRIVTTYAPERCATRRDDYRCKACPCASVCWHDAKTFVDPSVPISCRTCCHSSADITGEGARWTCKLGHVCTTANTTDCEDHLFLPTFVIGEPTDGDDYGILYSFEVDGKTDGITIGKRGYSSSEAQKIAPCQKHALDAIKKSFPEAKAVSAVTLPAKYASDKYTEYFIGTKEQLAKWCEKNPIADFTKPIHVEEQDGIGYYEYAPSTLVIVDKSGMATVKQELPPF